MQANMNLHQLIKQSKESLDLLTIEATVTTGFEFLAQDECREKCRPVSMTKAKGRIFFNIPASNFDTVLTLRSVDNVLLVTEAIKEVPFDGRKVNDLETVKSFVDVVNWERSLNKWAHIIDFKGVMYPLKSEKSVTLPTDLCQIETAVTSLDDWKCEGNTLTGEKGTIVSNVASENAEVDNNYLSQASDMIANLSLNEGDNCLSSYETNISNRDDSRSTQNLQDKKDILVTDFENNVHSETKFTDTQNISLVSSVTCEDSKQNNITSNFQGEQNIFISEMMNKSSQNNSEVETTVELKKDNIYDVEVLSSEVISTCDNSNQNALNNSNVTILKCDIENEFTTSENVGEVKTVLELASDKTCENVLVTTNQGNDDVNILKCDIEKESDTSENNSEDKPLNNNEVCGNLEGSETENSCETSKKDSSDIQVDVDKKCDMTESMGASNLLSQDFDNRRGRNKPYGKRGKFGGKREQRRVVKNTKRPKTDCDDNILKFRATCYRVGERHSFSSMEAACEFGGMLQDKFGWTVDLTGYDLNVVLNIEYKLVYICLSVTRESLHRRNITHFCNTTLRATMCYNLIRLAEPVTGEIVIDPLCGGGSISIEGSLSFPNTFHICGDYNSKAVERTRANIEYLIKTKKDLKVGPILWNVKNLPLKPNSIDVLVTDLPFGKRSGAKQDNQRLYTRVLFELAKVVRKGSGRACLLTYDKTSLIRALRTQSDYWREIRQFGVNQGGLFSTVFLLLRKATPMLKTQFFNQKSDVFSHNRDIAKSLPPLDRPATTLEEMDENAGKEEKATTQIPLPFSAVNCPVTLEEKADEIIEKSFSLLPQIVADNEQNIVIFESIPDVISPIKEEKSEMPTESDTTLLQMSTVNCPVTLEKTNEIIEKSCSVLPQIIMTANKVQNIVISKSVPDVVSPIKEEKSEVPTESDATFIQITALAENETNTILPLVPKIDSELNTAATEMVSDVSSSTLENLNEMSVNSNIVLPQIPIEGGEQNTITSKIVSHSKSSEEEITEECNSLSSQNLTKPNQEQQRVPALNVSNQTTLVENVEVGKVSDTVLTTTLVECLQGLEISYCSSNSSEEANEAIAEIQKPDKTTFDEEKKSTPKVSPKYHNKCEI